LKLNGENFKSGNIQIRIRNEKFSVKFTNGITYKSSNLIEFLASSIEAFNFTSSLRYPISFQLGLSFNSGFEFTEKELIMIDKYSNLYLYQIIPTITPRTNRTINLQGIGFEYAKSCLFKSNSVTLHQSNVTRLGSSIQCYVDENTLSQSSKITIFVVNEFNDTSNGFDLTVYSKFHHSLF